jgi:hypothetical protein
MPDSLCKVLSTKKIIKVGAAVNEDIRGLQRYTKFIPRGFVDLQAIGYNWNIKEKSVRKMAAIVLGANKKWLFRNTSELSNPL